MFISVRCSLNALQDKYKLVRKREREVVHMRERDSVYDRVSERVARYVKEGDCACHILKEYVLSKARERESV